jgi:hypothetical protein
MKCRNCNYSNQNFRRTSCLSNISTHNVSLAAPASQAPPRTSELHLNSAHLSCYPQMSSLNCNCRNKNFEPKSDNKYMISQKTQKLQNTTSQRTLHEHFSTTHLSASPLLSASHSRGCIYFHPTWLIWNRKLGSNKTAFCTSTALAPPEVGSERVDFQALLFGA